MTRIQTKTLTRVFITGALYAIPVETLSYILGHVTYPISRFKLPIHFPVSGLFFYGIYACAFYMLYNFLKSLIAIKPGVLSTLLSFFIASTLGLLMEYLAVTSGYMEYTQVIKDQHADPKLLLPVKLSVYMYYTIVVNFPLLLLIKRFVRVGSPSPQKV